MRRHPQDATMPSIPRDSSPLSNGPNLGLLGEWRCVPEGDAAAVRLLPPTDRKNRHCGRTRVDPGKPLTWNSARNAPILTEIREEVRASCSVQRAASKYLKTAISAASAAPLCRARVQAAVVGYPPRTVSVASAGRALRLETWRHPGAIAVQLRRHCLRLPPNGAN